MIRSLSPVGRWRQRLSQWLLGQLQCLSVRRRLVLTGFLLALPVMALLSDMLPRALSDWRTVRNERQGVQAAYQVRQAAAALQRSGQQRRLGTDWTTAMESLQRATAGWPELNMAGTRGRLQEAAAALVSGAPLANGRDPTQVAAGELLQLLDGIGAQSELLFDPEPETFMVMDLVVTRLPVLAAAVAEVGAYVQPGAVADQAQLLVAIGRIEQASDAALLRLTALQGRGVAVQAPWQDALRSLVTAGRLAMPAQPSDPGQLQALRTAYLRASEVLRDAGEDWLRELDRRLAARESLALARLVCLPGLTLLALALVVGLAVACYAAFIRSLRSLHQAVRRVAAGDLSAPVAVPGNDELAALGRELDQMATRLSRTVAEIRSSATRVDQAGSAIAADGSHLSAGSGAQVGQFRSAMQLAREVSAGVSDCSGLVARLNDRTRTLDEDGQACLDVVQRAQTAMGQLQASVKRVTEINAVIDEMAFQTNLLSLNAQVEASRAGEAGKGFGVVAGEVRQLSIRCADAAAEVQALIDETAGLTALALQTVDTSSGLMGRLVAEVVQVGHDLNRVAHAGQAHALGLAGLIDNLGALDARVGTHDVAARAAAVATGQLATQADALHRSVAAIQLRQGSADEARALVERALQRIGQIGWDRAVVEFHGADTGFVDRDMYLFALDAQGCYLVLGANVSALGRSILEMPNVTPTIAGMFLERARDAVAAGGGWIDYDAVHVRTGRQLRKSAYIADLGDGAFIGCAVERAAPDHPAGVVADTARAPAPLDLASAAIAQAAAASRRALTEPAQS